ncbi:uncharacterized protein UV8b_02227 [Ustilaginoidea virens]|uniref:Uncharacterized protein n=1 Tax=Ustilaginoidea virens TaxID=1159556 RepID=A0A8E5MFE8_USTVR|nr:uncharacterized protein UV8b_02227 [Ustilaginoidea virens]QUC17986.1 hypothetical protein UV8b_02227 [Ustilaginoidea virens]
MLAPSHPHPVSCSASAFSLPYQAACVRLNPSLPAVFRGTRPDSSCTGLSSSLFEDGARLRVKDPADFDDSQKPFDEEASSQPGSQHRSASQSWSRRGQPQPQRAVRVSKNTHSAVLFALEALRHPDPFTPDVVEESADMADLMAATSGVPPGALTSHSTTAPRRPTAGPAPTSSPSGIRGPRMIMQERAAREARQRAEAEKLALERNRAEQEAQEARLLEEAAARRGSAEDPSAGVAAEQGSGARLPSQQLQADPRGHGHAAQETLQSLRNTGATTTAKTSTQQQQQQQQLASRQQLQPPPPNYITSSGRPRIQQQATANAAKVPREGASQQTTERAKPISSFPHAFERWETLSAHWEGLTSYWIKKLEQNQDDISREPLSQQLARQVTDLSAAGANLFHAVVELQRLRASSERKFQRWFFETRAELERAQEVNGMLEKALEGERRERADAIRDAVDHERGSSKAQKQLAEMRKELAISKEEARRAWEELGRREQEERDRTLSLQSGHPTIVGGVQVVPMTQGGGVVSRQGTGRDAGAYPAEYAQGYAPERSRPDPTSPQPTAAGPSSTHQATGQPSHAGRAGGSEGGFSEDDYDTPATTNPPSGGHDPPAASSTGDSQWTGAYASPQDYSGQGYGTPGWETVPRHHHPTRLSDVIEEEDERSRTSASQSHSRAG